MTDNTHDINDALKGNYLLVTLSISRWNASKPDHNLAVETATAHGASPEAVRVTKKLMAGADAELNDVNKALNTIRTYIYTVSLPWAGNDEGAKRGPRLIPTAKSLEIIKQLKAYQDAFKQAMTALKGAYNGRVQQALRNQGSLADPTQYPDVSELDSMFTVRMDIEPVPTVSDFSRMSLPAEVANALGKRMAGRQSKVIENAMADLTNRIVTSVSNMATQLHKHKEGTKTRLYASLVDNVKVLLDLLKTSNLTNDPHLSEVADMMSTIVVHDIATIKDNPSLAGAIAEKADAIVLQLNKGKAETVPVPQASKPAATAREALSSPPAADYGDYLY